MPDDSAVKGTAHPAIARRGRLELEFLRDLGGRTYIGRQFSSYPFHICRPFHLDGGSCAGMATVYTQSCSGGIYGLDRLATVMTVRAGAQAHLTTQASTVVHCATDGVAEQSCSIAVEEDALAEYLPDAVILFPGAHLKASVRLTLAESASAILFDSFLAHDYEGRANMFDLFDNTVVIDRPDGKPLAIDRFRITGKEFASGGIGVVGGFTCHGSVMAVAPGVDPDALIGTLRETSGALQGCSIGLSRLPGANGFSARILARDAVPMRKAMLSIWRQFRVATTGAPPKPRRK